MRNIYEKESGTAYLVDDYSLRQQVTNDLEQGKRVAIIALESDKDVLAFYGLILQQYNQFNLYPVSDIEEVDDDFIEAVTTQDQSEEDVHTYVGKPLTEMVSETIEEISPKLTAPQKRIMAICGEILKGGSDTQANARIALLNTRLSEERTRTASLEKELEQLRTTHEDEMTTTQYIKSSILLDSLGPNINTSVMYIREYSQIHYLHTCLRAYCNYLNIVCNKRAKLVMFDDRLFHLKYNDFHKIDSQEEYMGNRNLYANSNESLCCYQIFPKVIDDLYKNEYDVLILIDRILNKQDLVKGKNVHKYVTTGNDNILESLLAMPHQDFTIITSPELEYPDSIIIRKVKQDMSTDKNQMYWYQKLPNGGSDNRLIFDIFNEKNTNPIKTKRGAF